MESRLLALKLFLDALSIPSDISSIDDRKRVQKAVYLGQLAGADLGYRFGWYLLGPYSPSLTKDYFALAEAIAAKKPAEEKKLRPDLEAKLQAVRPLMDSRIESLAQENWLELLASVHYLRNISKLDDTKAREVFRKEKPHLMRFYDTGLQVLREASL